MTETAFDGSFFSPQEYEEVWGSDWEQLFPIEVLAPHMEVVPQY